MSESYAKPWTSATIHVNLDTGEMHSDGDHLVRQWIEETISLYKKENAELLAANAADESPQLIAGLESLVDELEKSNAELLAAMKETSATLHAADSEAMQLPQPRLLLLAVDRGNQLIVIRDLDAAIAAAEVSDET